MDIFEKTGRGLRELALFAGAGGGILGGKMLGWRTVCAVEIDPYCQSVLCQRQNEGLLEVFPIWDDVCTFDGTAWKGYVDVISGGFPCQDISVANIEGAGIEGERSGLWKEMRRIISEVRPQWVFVENSPMLVHRGLDRVLGDLAELGYDAEYGIMGADDVGASHERQRMWILAGAISDPSSARCEQQESSTGEHSGEGQSYVRDDDSVFPDTSSEIMERFGGRKSRDEQTRYASADNSEAVSEPEGTEPRDGTDTVGGETYESWTDWTDFFLHGRGKYANKGGGIHMVETKEDERLRIYNTRGNEPVCFKDWWQAEPNVGRVADGVAARLDRLKAIGNGQVPAVMATAWCVLLRRFLEKNPE